MTDSAARTDRAARTDTAHSVISGVAFPVTSLRGDAPAGLDAFTGTTEFTLDMGGSPYVVRGCGALLDGCVRFHEKHDVVGKDVRVWQVVQAGSAFTAEHVAAF